MSDFPIGRTPGLGFQASFALWIAVVGSTASSAQDVSATKDRPDVAPVAAAPGAVFEVAYPEQVADGRPITARVYVMLAAPGTPGEPRLGPNWFRPQPFFARDVRDWKPGESIRIDARAHGFPDSLDKLAPGAYRAQAVVRLNLDTARIGSGEGNLHGPIVEFTSPTSNEGPIKLVVDQIVAPREFKETDRIKYAELPSPLLSAFLGRPIKHRAAVILPKRPTGGKSPAVYIITGFGGDHHSAPRYVDFPGMHFADDMTRIVLDADCGTGHHVFADSANNGPRGQALIEEFIPYLEATHGLIPDPRARLLNGHSSGGWSSLWLQTAYPDFFGGTWSTSPDPVDFHDFQRIDLYAAGENVFRDRQGERRPIARMGTKPVLFYEDFSRMEDVMGFGGQLGSFEAVFSSKGADGSPIKLWDRKTGAIDPATARAWENYDIRLVLERNWPTIGPKLAGKIHVITGSLDTFYLEGAVEKLKSSLEKLGSDADVEILPDKDHSNILDRALADRIDRGMQAAVAPALEAR
ncbi:alpha/beta hydrolase-fold protein [Planctomyces sp. SH-PL62]|uniref:alpha/beta hydrolase-fold protein n=1 Tax=Planctomyces sp. SH-PL62 TaxID=1636152 RepID=UPI00078D5295|nr:alpha/beta hydrolase-fold protein [Planctomyces sp. SH-PL62]AMV39071.1 Alpha/beta hydrolase family protein [Planctomyces sp. SH-PL62]